MAELQESRITPLPVPPPPGAVAAPWDDAADEPRITAAIRYLAEHYTEQPSLDALAAQAHLHPHHFQRIFKRWAGVSPKRFAQFLTVEHAKALLRESASVLDAALDVGLSGPSRLHDLFLSCEAMTPGEYKAAGRDLVIRYGVHPSPFGPVLAAVTDRGICFLGFLLAEDPLDPANGLSADWGSATLVEDPAATAAVVAAAFGGVRPDGGLHLLVKGTNFQVKVWRALLAIPPGETRSYGAVAAALGLPKAARAVGNACANNPVALLIPCHRVTRGDGVLGRYRWGEGRKARLVAKEAALGEAGGLGL